MGVGAVAQVGRWPGVPRWGRGAGGRVGGPAGAARQRGPRGPGHQVVLDVDLWMPGEGGKAEAGGLLLAISETGGDRLGFGQRRVDLPVGRAVRRIIPEKDICDVIAEGVNPLCDPDPRPAPRTRAPSHRGGGGMGCWRSGCTGGHLGGDQAVGRRRLWGLRGARRRGATPGGRGRRHRCRPVAGVGVWLKEGATRPSNLQGGPLCRDLKGRKGGNEWSATLGRVSGKGYPCPGTQVVAEAPPHPGRASEGEG